MKLRLPRWIFVGVFFDSFLAFLFGTVHIDGGTGLVMLIIGNRTGTGTPRSLIMDGKNKF